MGTRGTGVYQPSGGFAFPRSYIAAVDVVVDAPVFQTANTMYFVDGGDPLRVFRVGWLDEFWAWNSNRYTLDFVLTDSYYTYGSDPTKTPVNFSLHYKVDAVTGKPRLEYYPFSIGFTTHHEYALQSPTSPYWRGNW